MPLITRLTERLGIEHPVISAPMAFAAGGRLAAAVSAGGGLGLIGGGYGDADWIDEQFRAAGNARVGCGFITWSLAKQPALLDTVLERSPAAIFLSFGDPRPFGAAVREAGALLICQVQTVADARAALAAGADIVVAQGAEAGGHGEKRATLTLVPEVADLLSREAPDTLLCAAGGIADGRGLAAALMLGADGALVGSRFWASPEANVHGQMHAAALAADGDATIRSSVMDIARKLEWPSRFTARVLRNGFTDMWHGREADLVKDAEGQSARWKRAWETGDVDVANTFVGECVGQIRAIEPAGDILRRIVREAEACLSRGRSLVS
ncbi:MAG: NAD(P)H-dependent flavin oxidoreductase [Hyphomicrobiales bacterium]